MQITFHNKFLTDWLKLTAGAESPPLFNLWTAISGIGAAAGRRHFCTIGRFTYVPNQYIVLIGPAAVRKSSAGSIIKDLLLRYTTVKFGPSDTGGQRQGLISEFIDAYDGDGASSLANDARLARSRAVKAAAAKTPKAQSKQAELANLLTNVITNGLAIEQPAPSTTPGAPTAIPKSSLFANIDLSAVAARSEQALANLSSDTSSGDKASASQPVYTGPRELYVFADEFGSFIGTNQLELVNCLTDLYYPKNEYRYKLARTAVTVNKPNLNLLACTTPTSLAAHLPASAIGQGFSSRTIFIYEGSPQPKIFPAPALDQDLAAKLGDTLNVISSRESCEITLSPAGSERLSHIYHNYTPKIEDARFTHYEQRRLDHLIKLAMNLCIAELRTEISAVDIDDAQSILVGAERNMSFALGELGMSKISIARQRMKEMIEASWPHGISMSMLKANMLRDMTANDFNVVLNEFTAKGICSVTESGSSTSAGGRYILVLAHAPDRIRAKSDRLLGAFASKAAPPNPQPTEGTLPNARLPTGTAPATNTPAKKPSIFDRATNGGKALPTTIAFNPNAGTVTLETHHWNDFLASDDYYDSYSGDSFSS